MAGDDGDVAFFLDELVTFLSKDEVARQAFSAGALRLVARLQAAADDCASACTRSGSRQPVVELRLRICTALYAGGWWLGRVQWHATFACLPCSLFRAAPL